MNTNLQTVEKKLTDFLDFRSQHRQLVDEWRLAVFGKLFCAVKCERMHLERRANSL